MMELVKGGSIYAVDGIQLFEPTLIVQWHRPGCTCDAAFDGIWSFAHVVRTASHQAVVECRKCGVRSAPFDSSEWF